MIWQVQEKCSVVFQREHVAKLKFPRISRTGSSESRSCSLSVLTGAVRIAAACGLLALGGMTLAALPALAEETSATSPAASTTLDRKEIEAIIREYLVSNPEILLEVQQALEDREMEQQRISQASVIEEAKDDLLNSPSDAVLGNPRGKISIVEFYDYNCGFCKHALADMIALTAANPELRFVLKEYPILGNDSLKAHIVSQAFLKLMPEKYAEFHTRMLSAQSRATEESALKLALSLGADEAKLRKTMKDPSITQAFSKNHDLAERLAITGTPSYVIGNEVVFGALGTEVLTEKIAAAKACDNGQAC